MSEVWLLRLVKMLTIAKMRHPKADVDRLYLPEHQED